MLTFVGLGLYDPGDISVKGLECVKSADVVYLESYTSRLMGTDVAGMEAFFGKEVRVLAREDVEQDPRDIIEHALHGHVAFLTGGDPMVSTTHADLRIRAAAAGVATAIVHASSISSAVCGLSGLQNYRFGKSCSVPFPAKGWFPTAPVETIAANLACNLHTLVYLDIQKDRYMRIPEAIAIVEEMAAKRGIEPP
ncbi:MAG TPA: diphthine synthase, partial [Methanoculleus sp.]|nr:diphthine synthase [Methanoculleus sp.]